MKRISTQHILACVGNTAGEVAIWVLPGSRSEIDPSDLPEAPLCMYRGNQVGTNCVVVGIVDSSSNDKCADISIANGGDDQAVSCSLVSVELDNNGKVSATIRQVVTATACASAVKGISIAGDSKSAFRVYTVGYDQRLY